jgi:hypothetical protein
MRRFGTALDDKGSSRNELGNDELGHARDLKTRVSDIFGSARKQKMATSSEGIPFGCLRQERAIFDNRATPLTSLAGRRCTLHPTFNLTGRRLAGGSEIRGYALMLLCERGVAPRSSLSKAHRPAAGR